MGGKFAQNLVLLLSPGTFCDMPRSQVALAGVVWFSWNTLLLLLVIDAHGVCLKDQAKRSDGTVADEPITFHWPKLIMWLIFFSALRCLQHTVAEKFYKS